MKRNHFLIFILAIVTLLICLQGHATPISLEKARSNALTFLNSRNMKRVKGEYAIKKTSAYEKSAKKARRISSEEPALYVFNLVGGGYILASGDDCTEPILAYGESGDFNLDSIPSNAKAWIDGYVEEISWAREQGLTASDFEKAKSNAPSNEKSTIAVMLKSKWNQDSPFNNQCEFAGDKCRTGCGATAIAQILYYWAITKNAFRYGCQALGAYTTITKGYNVPALGNLSSFKWDDMIDDEPTSTTNINAVAQLMRYCGQSVQMDYTQNLSTCSISYICYSLKDNFYYNSGITCISNDEKTGTDWNDMVYDELAAGCPVIMSGSKSDKSDEHIFICDGYDASNDKYHINWGWGGWRDSWFAMSALNPYTNRDYNFHKEAIIGIQPTKTDPYIVLSPDKKTLSFYCDNKKYLRSGTFYDLNSFMYDFKDRSTITLVVFDSSFANARPTSTRQWFYNMANLSEITNIGYLNTSNVTDMSSMFYNCQSLTSINLSQFNTAKVTDMNYMFSGCSNLVSANLSSFDTSNVTDMGRMFQYCQSLKSINLSQINTASVTDMSYMFSGCSKLASIDLSKFNMSKVTSSSYMLDGCTSLKSVSISSSMHKASSNAFSGVGTTSAPCVITAPSGFNFEDDTTGFYFKWKSGYFFLKGNKMSYTILNDSKLSFFHDASPWSRSGTKYTLNTGAKSPEWNGSKATIVEVSFDASFENAKPTSTYKWFEGMTKLATINNIGHLNTTSVTNMGYMFQNCKLLKSINLSRFNTANVTNMNYMFDGCSGLTSISFATFDMTNVSSSNYIARNCTSLTSVTISQTISKAAPNAFTNVGKDTAPCYIVAPEGFEFDVDITGFYFKWKSGCFFLKDNKMSYAILNGSKLSFFHDASPWSRTGTKYTLNSGNEIPGWNENKASITEVSFDASFENAKPTSTYKWFEGMTKLATINNIGHLNTTSVTNMGYMFQNCKLLTLINLSKFNTAQTTNMDYMFDGCSDISSISLAQFDMTNVVSSEYMVRNCTSLTGVTISETISKAAPNAFTNVGKDTAPCYIVAPEGFDFGVGLTGLYFNWKSGCFFLKGHKVSYAILNGSKLSFFHDASPWSKSSGTKYALNTGTFVPAWNKKNASITAVSFDASFANAKPTTTYKWFEGMTNLTSLSGMNYLDMSNVSMNSYMFYGCSKLTSIPIPASTKSIGSNMFEGCSGLTSVVIPNGVKSIGSRAFYGCSKMTETYLPLSVARIDADAFNGCINQVKVKVGFSSPISITSNVFTNRRNAFLIVPVGCKTAFENAAYWKEFKGVFEDKEYEMGDVNHDGDVSITDAMLMVNYILGDEQSYFFIENADIDKDGVINVTDVTNLVDIVLAR